MRSHVVALAGALCLAGCSDTTAENSLRVAGHVEATEVQVSSEVGGRILELKVDEGARVMKGDVIATLDDVSVIKLDFTIPEQFLAAVASGTRLEAEAAAYPGETFAGEVSQIDSRVDPRSVSSRPR